MSAKGVPYRLFYSILFLERLMNDVLDHCEGGMKSGGARITDLTFADDIIIMDDSEGGVLSGIFDYQMVGLWEANFP